MFLRMLFAAAAVTAALGVLVGPSFGDNKVGSGSIDEQPPSVTGTCFWNEPIRQDTDNTLALDTNVTYYYTSYQLPPGAQVLLHGEFPHSRFMSLTSYKTLNGRSGLANAALTDFEIDPDPGSDNPFRSDTMRTVHNRSYTLTLSGDADPGVGNRASNTLYTGQAGQTGLTQLVELIYRIYRPDKNYDLAGGVVLPVPTLVRVDGSMASGQPLCDELVVVSGAGTPIPRFGPPIGLQQTQYNQLLALGPPTHPAVNPIVWDRFFNPQRVVEPFLRHTILAPQIAALPPTLSPGVYATPANAYLIGYANRSFGPDPDGHNILVLRGKMPIHPTTFQRNPHNDSADRQVRYWSLCNYGALVVQAGTGPVDPDGCLFDEQIPTDTAGDFTIVVSLPEDRPANATQACGVAWLDWGTKGDWLGRPQLITLVMRNQLAAMSFVEGIDKVLTPGTEALVMDGYYPLGTYMSGLQFEAGGCSAR